MSESSSAAISRATPSGRSSRAEPVRDGSAGPRASSRGALRLQQGRIDVRARLRNMDLRRQSTGDTPFFAGVESRIRPCCADTPTFVFPPFSRAAPAARKLLPALPCRQPITRVLPEAGRGLAGRGRRGAKSIPRLGDALKKGGELVARGKRCCISTGEESSREHAEILKDTTTHFGSKCTLYKKSV